jgi:hypothetical protein
MVGILIYNEQNESNKFYFQESEINKFRSEEIYGFGVFSFLSAAYQ